MQKSNLFQYSIVAALAGFIFGFDTVVISGANLPIKELWHTGTWFHGFFIMSMALWGTVFGAMFGGIPTQKYGRKKVLFWIGVMFAVSALGSALAMDPYTFSAFRFIGGIGIGVSSVVAPTYISEISTPKTRGRLVGLYQFNIVFGILIAFFSNYLLKGFDGANDWRWMLGVLAIPSVIYTVMVMAVPESPRWLITRKNDAAGALKTLQKIGVSNPEEEIKQIVESSKHEASTGHTRSFFSSKYKTVLWLAFLVAFFNQLSGINFILYYAPEILIRAGIGTKDSLFNSIAIGGINLIFTFVGLYLIDRVGRKTLLIIGSIGYIVSLAMVGYAFRSVEMVNIDKVSTGNEQTISTNKALSFTPQEHIVVAFDTANNIKGDVQSYDAATGSLKLKVTEKKGTGTYTSWTIQGDSNPLPAATAANSASNGASPTAFMLMIFLLAFIASHAIGQGAIIWVFISEIFPNNVRAFGQSFGCSVHWVFAAIITLITPVFLDNKAGLLRDKPWIIFAFFSGMMVLQLIWTLVKVPETKGVSLEELEKKLIHE